MPFIKTPRQIEALDVLNKHTNSMLFGGSRSGKTALIIRTIFLRAAAKTSKHLIVRFRFNAARTSLGHETIPFIIRECFPNSGIEENKSDNYWTVPAADGGESQVWLGGTDDRDRIEKVLGNEYSTIYINEASQVPWEAVTMLMTRLAETSGLSLKMFYDCNPPGKKHWTNLVFHEGILPDEFEPHGMDIGSIQMNPIHNLANLPPEYIKTLERLPLRQRKRFLEGLYLSDVEGALWTDRMIAIARAKEPAEVRKTVISVDPSVSHTKHSDEVGIGVVSLDTMGEGIIHDDLSGKMSTRTWANRVVSAFHAWEANEVVAEKNQGGDLVKDAIHNIDPGIKVVLVHAAKGKFARAEPVSMLYEPGQEKVAHVKHLPQLEAELTEYDFDPTSKKSPNRLDWLVWGLTHLMIKSAKRVNVG